MGAMTILSPLSGGTTAPYHGYVRLPLAQVAELVDALASGASGRKVVEVRVFSWAPINASFDVQVPDFQAF
jgi:hypothetical protein